MSWPVFIWACGVGETSNEISLEVKRPVSPAFPKRGQFWVERLFFFF